MIAQTTQQESEETVQVPDAWSRLRRQSWARLLQKVYEVDPFVCPKCQGTMSVVAIIEDPRELSKIIEWAQQQERDPQRTASTRSPPELALVLVYYPKTECMRNRIPSQNQWLIRLSGGDIPLGFEKIARIKA